MLSLDSSPFLFAFSLAHRAVRKCGVFLPLSLHSRSPSFLSLSLPLFGNPPLPINGNESRKENGRERGGEERGASNHSLRQTLLRAGEGGGGAVGAEPNWPQTRARRKWEEGRTDGGTDDPQEVPSEEEEEEEKVCLQRDPGRKGEEEKEKERRAFLPHCGSPFPSAPLLLPPACSLMVSLFSLSHLPSSIHPSALPFPSSKRAPFSPFSHLRCTVMMFGK